MRNNCFSFWKRISTIFAGKLAIDIQRFVCVYVENSFATDFRILIPVQNVFNQFVMTTGRREVLPIDGKALSLATRHLFDLRYRICWQRAIEFIHAAWVDMGDGFVVAALPLRAVEDS